MRMHSRANEVVRWIYKVLVTGGAGFIGSHLPDRLSKLGCSIVVFDDMSKGRLENIRSLMIERNVKLIRGDVRQYLTVEHAVKYVEYVFHAVPITEIYGQLKNNSFIRRAKTHLGFHCNLSLDDGVTDYVASRRKMRTI